MAAAWFLAAGVARAQGCGGPAAPAVQPDDGGVLRFQQIVGPYEIRVALVQSSLSLGTTLVAVYVVDKSTCQPVPDARVLLLTRHEDEDNQGRATAHNTPGELERYDAQMTLEASGEWNLTIEVASDLGTVAVEVPTLTVEAGRQFSGGTYVFIGVFAVIIAGAAYLWWSSQRRRRRLGERDPPGDGAGRGDDPGAGFGPP